MGDIVWVPMFWWHETCGLDVYSVGIGGVSYPGCEHETHETCSGPADYKLEHTQLCTNTRYQDTSAFDHFARASTDNNK